MHRVVPGEWKRGFAEISSGPPEPDFGPFRQGAARFPIGRPRPGPVPGSRVPHTLFFSGLSNLEEW